MGHTKTPWVHKPSSFPHASIITSEDHKTENDNRGWAICTLHGPDSFENGEKIVRAVNSFEPMLEALKLAWRNCDPSIMTTADCKVVMAAISQAEPKAEKA